MNATNNNPAFETRIDLRFKTLSDSGKKGFVAFVTAGDPDLAGTMEIILELEKVGVDVIELGLPFSDPLADGPTNQESAARALESGATTLGVFDMVKDVRKQTDIPLMCYSYMNPLHNLGFDKAMKRAKASGIDGFLLLDLPVEEAEPYHQILNKHELNHVYLVTPTSPKERIKQIVRRSTGFVYCVSRLGVTGMQKQVAGDASPLIKMTQSLTDLPVALGFGISNPEQAATTARFADAVVVGSAIVDRFNRESHDSAGRRKAARWVGKLVKAVKSV